jgi:hypothetical protein
VDVVLHRPESGRWLRNPVPRWQNTAPVGLRVCDFEEFDPRDLIQLGFIGVRFPGSLGRGFDFVKIRA